MAEISRPWVGITVGDSGPYSADQWHEIYRNAMGNGAADGDSGPIMGSGTAPDPGLTVNATGPVSATVDVTLGAALVHGTYYRNSATKNLTIAANVSGLSRIDTVILRKDWTLQTVRLAILQGSPAASPAAPGLTQSDGVLWEIPLADILVATGFASLAQSTITPRRYWANVSDGIYLNDVLNNTAGILETGDVVIIDTAANRAATTTTTANDLLVMGVWVARTAAGGYGRVLRQGIGYVKCTTAVTRGDNLAVSGTAKSATIIVAPPTAGYDYARIATALETTSGAGLALCLIQIPYLRSGVKAFQRIIRDNGANYTTTSAAFVDIDGTNLAITLVITGSAVLVTFTCMGGWTGANQGGVDILVDGTRYASAGADGIVSYNNLSPAPVSISILITGLSAGSHTFKPQFKSNGSGTATIYSGSGVWPDTLPVFAAAEQY